MDSLASLLFLYMPDVVVDGVFMMAVLVVVVVVVVVFGRGGSGGGGGGGVDSASRDESVDCNPGNV